LTVATAFGYKLSTMTLTTADRPLADCDPRYRDTVVQMLRSQAWRELSAAQLFGHGLQFVSDLRTLKFISRHVQEEVEHYAIIADLYQTHVGESVDPWVTAKLATRPIPWAGSFLELGIAQWLYDRGGFWQLREYEDSSWIPYREVIGRIVEQEEGHQYHGQNIAVPLIRNEKDRDKVQRIFNAWLRQGLICLGRPRSEGNRYAISVGLKKRDSSECIKDYVKDILPAVREAGLRLPPREQIGVDLPDDIEWPTD
jgi:1,2-phenylacetyl-CoA epoxidase catalytic subunit